MNQATLVALGILLAVLLPVAAVLLVVLVVELRGLRRRVDALEAHAAPFKSALSDAAAPAPAGAATRVGMQSTQREAPPTSAPAAVETLRALRSVQARTPQAETPRVGIGPEAIRAGAVLEGTPHAGVRSDDALHEVVWRYTAHSDEAPREEVRIEPVTLAESPPFLAPQYSRTPAVGRTTAEASTTPAWSAPASSASPRKDTAPSPHLRAAKQKPSLERLIGVTGAAIAGGVVLAIAGFYLVQYSIQQGLLSPAVRIALGSAAGLACVAGSSLVRRRGYVAVANALGGGGAVVMFAAFWAAHTLYDLWPFWLSFALMAGVTAWCCVASARYSSQTIALLGLLGGFATPIALSSGQDRPIGLFTYVLVLDLAFLYVAHKRRWPFLALAGILCTTGMQALWIFARMPPEWAPFGLLILGVSALLFTAFFAMQPATERGRWVGAQAAGILLPFALAPRFASQTSVGLGPHVYPVASLATLLAAAACWSSRRQRSPGIAAGAAVAVVALIWFWAQQATTVSTAIAWELCIATLVLAAVFQVACEWKRADNAAAQDLDASAMVSVLGLLLCSVIASITWGSTSALAPWMITWLLLALVVTRQAALTHRRWLPIVSAALVGVGLCVWCVVAAENVGALRAHRLRPESFIAILTSATAVLWIAARLVRDDRVRRDAWRGSALVPLVSFFAVGVSSRLTDGSPWAQIGVPAALGALAAVGALGARSGLWLSVAFLLTAIAQSSPIAVARSVAAPEEISALFSPLIATAAVFTSLPLVTRTIASRSGGTWRAAALVAPVWFFLALAAKELDSWTWPGSIPFALSVLPGIAWWVVTKRAAHATAAPALEVARVGFAASALALLALVAPLQIEHDWALVGASLIALAWARLRRRHARAWLGLAAVALIVVATWGLVVERVDERFTRYDHMLWNPMLWTFLVPALAALDVAHSLARSGDDVGRFLAPQEPSKQHNASAASCALCAIVLAFAWLNLVILNAFGSEPRFAWPSGREPARDLTLSCAWALYAILLLVLGLKRASTALRWVSLALLLLTIAKVFLFDLGELQGLYRVGSLAGLAASLLLVSVLYQRFVFRQSEARS